MVKTGKYLQRMTPPSWEHLMFRFKYFKQYMKKYGADENSTFREEFIAEVQRVSLVLLQWKTQLDSLMVSGADDPGIQLVDPDEHQQRSVGGDYTPSLPDSGRRVGTSSGTESMTTTPFFQLHQATEPPHVGLVLYAGIKDSDSDSTEEKPMTLPKSDLRLDSAPIQAYITDERASFQATGGPPLVAKMVLSSMTSQQLDSIGDIIEDLNSFIFLNRLALRKIVKKIDKVLNGLASNSIVPPLQRMGVLLLTFDTMPYVSALSAGYDALRKRERAMLKGTEAEIKGSSAPAVDGVRQSDTGNAVIGDSGNLVYIRSTTKYWVPLEKVPHFTMEVIKHLPLYVFDQKNSAWVSSVYLDSPDLALYHQRIHRLEGSKAVRIRWYGDTISRVVFLERKIHHESWVGAPSVKERLEMPYDEVVGWMAGAVPVKRHICMNGLGKEVVTMSEQMPLHPLVKTSCQRFAFQNGKKDASVRISLDTDLTFTPVGMPPWTTHQPHPNMQMFPFAILEIKLQVPVVPEWLEELLRQPYVQQVPNFSKFLQGIYSQYPEKCQQKPYWDDYVSAVTKQVQPSTGGGRPTSKGNVTLKEDRTRDVNAKIDKVKSVKATSKPGKRKEKKNEEVPAQENGRARHSPAPALAGSLNSQGTYSPETAAQRFRNFFSSKRGGGDADVYVPIDPSPRRAGSRNYKSFPTSQSSPDHDHSNKRRSCWPFQSGTRAELRDHSDSESDDDKDKKNDTDKRKKQSFLSKLADCFHGSDKPELPVKIEPKTFFANERTFIRWATIGVHLISVALALAVYTQYNYKTNVDPDYNPWHDYVLYFVLGLPCLIIVYGLGQFIQRDRALKSRAHDVVGDSVGPIILAVLLLASISFLVYFVLAPYHIPYVPPAGPNCTSSTIAPNSLFNLRAPHLGDIRGVPSGSLYVSAQNYILDFNPVLGSAAAPYKLNVVDRSKTHMFEAMDYDPTTGYLILGDELPGARSLVIVDPNANFAVVDSVSIEHFFLPADKVRLGGLVLLRNSTAGTTPGYELLVSGSFSWVYKIFLHVQKGGGSNASLLDTLPLFGLSQSLAQYSAIQNWNPTTKTWTVTSPPSRNAAATSSDSVGALYLSAGSLYVARDRRNVIELYGVISDLTTAPVRDTLGFAVQLGYPNDVMGVEGVHLLPKGLVVATGYPASLLKLWWSPTLYFGCASGLQIVAN